MPDPTTGSEAETRYRQLLTDLRTLADDWDTGGDARYGQNRIAKSVAARELRRILAAHDA